MESKALLKFMRPLRVAMNLSMKELGDKIGASESAISKYERGEREADYETLLLIAEALDTSVDYLFRGAVHGTECSPEDIVLLSRFHCASKRDQQLIKTILGYSDE